MLVQEISDEWMGLIPDLDIRQLLSLGFLGSVPCMSAAEVCMCACVCVIVCTYVRVVFVHACV